MSRPVVTSWARFQPLAESSWAEVTHGAYPRPSTSMLPYCASGEPAVPCQSSIQTWPSARDRNSASYESRRPGAI